ncbi:dihydrofolate reductase [Pontixanthobacter sp. CEM42]|uniref:dihydrofolate reductase n=1 Tax=Pontixanthobacter sp. CEM42 TaxID=2792077 RepID=UPI001ADFF680|nr:dihydrofolate reductase [Pontixanthobacter sp. CEM42]
MDSKRTMGTSDQTALLTSIVAIDKKGAIGCRNELPWKLKTDMQFFRSQTIGNTVIMGRKTFDSIGGNGLPRRTNIVLSHNNVLFANTAACQLALSIPESLFRAEETGSDEIFVVGGALTYGQFAPLVDRYLVTIVDYEVPDADAFLDPNILDTFEKWGPTLISETSASSDNDEHNFAIYEFCAPDHEERQAKRLELIDSFRSAIKKPKNHKRAAKAPGLPQDAFAF